MGRQLLTSACFCCSLKVASSIISVFAICVSFIMLYCITDHVSGGNYIRMKTAPQIFHVSTIFWLSISTIICSVLLIWGTLTKRIRLMFPWLITFAMLIVYMFYTFYFVRGLVSRIYQTMFAGFLIYSVELLVLVLLMYCWMCVYSLYTKYSKQLEIVTENSERNESHQFFESTFCCCTLKVGGIVIGVLCICSFLYMLTDNVIGVIEKDARNLNGNNDAGYDHDSYYDYFDEGAFYLFTMIWLNISNLVSSVLLIWGTMTKRIRMIVPWLITFALCIIYLAYEIFYIQTEARTIMDGFIIYSVLLLILAILIYIWVCVYSLYTGLVKEEKHLKCLPMTIELINAK